MKSLKTFITKNWYWVIPLIPPFVITPGMVRFYVEINYAGFTVSEAAQGIFDEGVIFGIFKYILFLFLSLSLFGFAILSLILFFLGRKFPKPLLIPVIIGGLVGIYSGWIPQVVEFYLPFYQPDPTGVGAQSGMEMLIWPILILPYLFEGALAGLLLTFCIGLILSFRSNLAHYRLNRGKRNWYLISAIVILCIFIFLILPMNSKRVFFQKFRYEAESKNTGKERLYEIFHKANDTKNFHMLSILANNPITPDSILREIYISTSVSKRFGVLSNIARNPNTPDEILYNIYEFCQPFVDNEPKSRGLLSGLLSYHGRAVNVLASLAEGHNIPESLLKKLAESNLERVRQNLAKNEHASIEILEMLSRDTDHSVRYNVVFNPEVTNEILLRLKNDPDDMIREMADFKLKKFEIKGN